MLKTILFLVLDTSSDSDVNQASQFTFKSSIIRSSKLKSFKNEAILDLDQNCVYYVKSCIIKLFFSNLNYNYNLIIIMFKYGNNINVKLVLKMVHYVMKTKINHVIRI